MFNSKLEKILDFSRKKNSKSFLKKTFVQIKKKIRSVPRKKNICTWILKKIICWKMLPDVATLHPDTFHPWTCHPDTLPADRRKPFVLPYTPRYPTPAGVGYFNRYPTPASTFQHIPYTILYKTIYKTTTNTIRHTEYLWNIICNKCKAFWDYHTDRDILHNDLQNYSDQAYRRLYFIRDSDYISEYFWNIIRNIILQDIWSLFCDSIQTAISYTSQDREKQICC